MSRPYDWTIQRWLDEGKLAKVLIHAPVDSWTFREARRRASIEQLMEALETIDNARGYKTRYRLISLRALQLAAKDSETC